MFTVVGLTPSSVYRFVYVAYNQFGASKASAVLTIAASSLPNPPINITVSWEKSTKT